jgi:hypothetical protein
VEYPEINQRQPGQCGYICMYKGKKVGVWAEGIYSAQVVAAKYFKAKKSYDVHCYLAVNSDGSEYAQPTTH